MLELFVLPANTRIVSTVALIFVVVTAVSELIATGVALAREVGVKS